MAALTPVRQWWDRLPANQRLLIRYGMPAVVVAVSGWFSWGKLGEIGAHFPDEASGITHAEVRLPAFAQIAEGGLGAEAASRVQTIAQKNAIIAREPQIDRDLARTDAERLQIESMMPTEQEKGAMRERLEVLAQKLVTVGSVRITSAQTVARGSGPSLPSEVLYDLSVTGTQDQIIQFINEIENNARNGRGRILIVRDIKITPGQIVVRPGLPEPERLPHKADITVVTFVKDAPQGGRR